MKSRLVQLEEQMERLMEERNALMQQQKELLGLKAELTVVIVDARLGRVSWRTVARGDGPDPWTALTRAIKVLTPGLP